MKDGKLWRGKERAEIMYGAVTAIAGWDVQSGRRLHLTEKWLRGNCVLLRERGEGKASIYSNWSDMSTEDCFFDSKDLGVYSEN